MASSADDNRATARAAKLIAIAQKSQHGRLRPGVGRPDGQMHDCRREVRPSIQGSKSRAGVRLVAARDHTRKHPASQRARGNGRLSRPRAARGSACQKSRINS